MTAPLSDSLALCILYAEPSGGARDHGPHMTPGVLPGDPSAMMTSCAIASWGTGSSASASTCSFRCGCRGTRTGMYLAAQLGRHRIAFRCLDNCIVEGADPAALQRSADHVTPQLVDHLALW